MSFSSYLDTLNMETWMPPAQQPTCAASDDGKNFKKTLCGRESRSIATQADYVTCPGCREALGYPVVGL